MVALPSDASPTRAPGILPLRLDGVGYRAVGQDLLRDVSLRLEPGTRTIILGPNGAGKTLLLRVCHGLLRPTSGTVRWEGLLATQAQRHQAMVFQKPVLLRRSAAANVAYPLQLNRMEAPAVESRVAEALRLMGLTELAHRPARVLSGGEQQRLALARAWAVRPEVLFLDEPTAHLDPAATRAIEEALAAIHAAGTTVLMTTHDMNQARRLADTILFMHRGRLLEHGPATSFFNAPRTPEAQAFIRGELVW
ncbi:MAG TPA: phosphate ABC transporter ATP-binding protein [bacterium]